MADTVRANFPSHPCSDCRETGNVYMKHWGVLVPPGEIGYFCPYCFSARTSDNSFRRPVRSLGEQSPIINCPQCGKQAISCGPMLVDKGLETQRTVEMFRCQHDCERDVPYPGEENGSPSKWDVEFYVGEDGNPILLRPTADMFA